MADAPAWYIIHCNPQADAMVADRLRQSGHEVLFLHYLVWVRPGNRPRLRKRALLPGYIFVGIVGEPEFYPIATTPGVTRILSDEKGPYQMKPEEIERLRDGSGPNGMVDMGEPAPGRRAPLRLGVVVRIAAGPFAGFQGPVTADDGRQTISVRTKMFGHERDIEVPAQAVQPITKGHDHE